MDKTNISDSLMVGYDQVGNDLPVLTIGRASPGDKIEIIRILGGESAEDLYNMILNYGNKSSIINARMMNDHNNCTMLMPNGNGRSMIKRNMAEIPICNDKSSQDLKDLIKEINKNVRLDISEMGEIE